VAVSNLLDADYEDEFGYPMPGREIQAGVTFTAGGRQQ